VAPAVTATEPAQTTNESALTVATSEPDEAKTVPTKVEPLAAPVKDPQDEERAASVVTPKMEEGEYKSDYKEDEAKPTEANASPIASKAEEPSSTTSPQTSGVDSSSKPDSSSEAADSAVSAKPESRPSSKAEGEIADKVEMRTTVLPPESDLQSKPLGTEASKASDKIVVEGASESTAKLEEKGDSSAMTTESMRKDASFAESVDTPSSESTPSSSSASVPVTATSTASSSLNLPTPSVPNNVPSSESGTATTTDDGPYRTCGERAVWSTVRSSRLSRPTVRSSRLRRPTIGSISTTISSTVWFTA
jgi:hypothetical protein